MTLLEFARGPALAFALAVFVIGSLWRLFGALRLPRRPDLSPAREGAPSGLAAAGDANLRAVGPRSAFAAATRSFRPASISPAAIFIWARSSS